MSKLIRATVPMCPECEIAMSGHPDYSHKSAMWCHGCNQTIYNTSYHWGYYAPDVAGEVEGVRSVARVIAGIPGCRDQATRLFIMAKVLEGKNE
jgi:hypothetical protein